MGLQGLLQGELYLFRYEYYITLKT